jgi:hypothetical protein
VADPHGIDEAMRRVQEQDAATRAQATAEQECAAEDHRQREAEYARARDTVDDFVRRATAQGVRPETVTEIGWRWSRKRRKGSLILQMLGYDPTESHRDSETVAVRELWEIRPLRPSRLRERDEDPNLDVSGSPGLYVSPDGHVFRGNPRGDPVATGIFAAPLYESSLAPSEIDLLARFLLSHGGSPAGTD